MYFLSLLKPEQREIYRNISQERMNIYLQGFVLGIILGIIYLKTSNNEKDLPTAFSCIYCFRVTYIHYTLIT